MSLKAAVEIFGYNLEDEKNFNLDDFKKHVDTQYVLKDNVLQDEEVRKKITGNIFGKINTKAAQTFGLKSSEVKEKTIEEIMELAKINYEKQLEEAKASAGSTDDEIVKKLEKELTTYKTKAEQLESGLTEWEQKYNNDITSLKGNLKQTKLQHKLNEIKSGIQFVDDFNTNQITKAGFETLINTKYKVDFDEEKEEIVVTDATGKPVKHPTKTGHFASYADILTMEAEANKLLKKNNGGNVVKKTVEFQQPTAQVPVRKIHPNAIKAVGSK